MPLDNLFPVANESRGVQIETVTAWLTCTTYLNLLSIPNRIPNMNDWVMGIMQNGPAARFFFIFLRQLSIRRIRHENW